MRKLLLLLLFVPSFCFAQQQLEELQFDIKSLEGGMWSNPSTNRVPDNAAPLIQNFFTDVESIAIERNGYEKRDTTVLGDTAAVTGLWEFVDNTGIEWIISFSSKTFYKNEIGETPTAFGLSASVLTPPSATVNLGKIWFTNGSDDLWWFDGSSTATVPSAENGQLIVSWRNRVVIGKTAGNRSTLYFSEDGDGTNWTLGGNPTDPFILQIGGGNDGFPVTCMWSTYIDNLIVGRKRDLWSISGFDQADINVREISSEIGCIQGGSMREFDGSLVFLSARGMEEMRGITIQSITEPIRDITDGIVGNTAQDRANIQTTQADWNAGTHTPTGYLSTEITIGSIELTTDTARTFIDISSTDFNAGTITDLESSTSTGQLSLILNEDTTAYACALTGREIEIGPVSGVICTGLGWQSIFSTFSYTMTSLTVRLGKEGDPGLVTIDLYEGNNSSPTVFMANIGTKNGNTITSASAGADYDFELPVETDLDANTTYYFKVTYERYEHTGIGIGCNGTVDNNVHFISAFPDDKCNTIFSNLNWYTTREAHHSIDGDFYAPATGNIVSRSFDVGVTTNSWLWDWEEFAVTEVLNNQSIVYETQTSVDDITWSTLLVATDGVKIPSDVTQYIRYKATLTSTDSLASPGLFDVTMPTTLLLRYGATFYSQPFEIGEDISSWGPCEILDTTEDATIEYAFASSASSSSFTGFASIVSGGVPAVSTDSWGQFVATFTATVSTSIARLTEFRTVWAEGSGAQPVQAWEEDRRYWISFTTGTQSAASNNSVLVYQRNRTWALIKGINASSFATFGDSLYFGNSDGTGYVYKYGAGNEDDGTDISSLIVFKSYDLGFFNQDKDLRNVYANYLGGQNGSFTLSYMLDRNPLYLYSLGSANMNEGIGQVAAKFPFSLANPVQGREIQYTLTKSGTGDRLKLYDLKTMLKLKEAR